MRSSLNGWFREVSLWMVVGGGTYLLLALVTYTPQDPGWSYVGPHDVVIRNAGGWLGAWCADVLIYLIGYIAFLFAIALVWSALLNLYLEDVRLSRHAHVLPLQWLSFLITVVASAALADIYVRVHPSEMPSGSGGVLGQFAASFMILTLSPLGGVVSLLFATIFGFTVFTNFPWLTIVGFIGRLILRVLGWIVWPLLFLVPKGHKATNTENATVDTPKNEPDKPPLTDAAVETANSSTASGSPDSLTVLGEEALVDGHNENELIKEVPLVLAEATPDNTLIPLEIK